MKWLKTERNDGLVRLVMDRGKNHAIDPVLVDELRRSFDELKSDDSVRAVILTGSGDHFFSNGLDVASLLELPRDGMTAFFDSFIALYTEMYRFPRPLVAAINGHAMAGGLILALTADFRLIGAENRYAGLSEVRLGLPVPDGAVQILTSLVGNRVAQRLALGGEMLLPEAAYRAGLVNEVTSFRHLSEVAETVARDLAAVPAAAFGCTKRYLRHPVASIIETTALSSRDEFLHCWYLPETQAALRKLVARKSRG
jgi:enoyl-CoA hydratase